MTSVTLVWILLLVGPNGDKLFTSPHRYTTAEACLDAVEQIRDMPSVYRARAGFDALCIPQPIRPLDYLP